MAETLIKNGTTKSEQYEELLTQLKYLVGNETNRIANLANVTAGLKGFFGFFWVGFYLVENEELVLGPFQGPVACSRIAFGKGVCGTAWKNNETILVPNVDEFPGHIACSSQSKSEIVVTIHKENTVVGVLDVDSDKLNDFDEIDQKYLEELCAWLGAIL
ncbi:MAG: GAF domain-containing protein [Bacteroidetes bacterium]|nr:GAF domain-containing protein [Bacteroidota bacterium]